VKFFLLASAFMGALAMAGYSQSPDAAKAEFEVASVKPAAPVNAFHSSDSGTGGPGSADPAMFRCTRCSLAVLISKAFGLERYQFPGQQSLPTDGFEIQARIPEGATQEQVAVMLQNLLKDRFGLVYHFENREVQGYHLTIAKSGPKLVAAKEPTAVTSAADGGEYAHGGFGGHRDGTEPMRPGLTFFYGGARYRGDHQTTAELARILANQIARPVDDQTGLTGKYDIRLNWAGETAHSGNHPEGAASGFTGGAGHDHGGGGGGGGNASPGPDTASGPTLFDAVQSQLGLELVAASKAPARVIVIDHIANKPTAN
jgi:uncharacterized protein (TIGR03435 family)